MDWYKGLPLILLVMAKIRKGVREGKGNGSGSFVVLDCKVLVVKTVDLFWMGLDCQKLEKVASPVLTLLNKDY